MEKRSLTLCSRLERAISSFLYGGLAGRARAWAVGLQVPLWFWTHQIMVESEREDRELQKVVNILRWFYDSGANLTQVAVIIPGAMKTRLRAEILHFLQDNSASRDSERGVEQDKPVLPLILAPHELTAMNMRDDTVHEFEVVVYLLALPPTSRSLAAAMQQEQFIGDAVASAKGAFIFIADVGWISPHITAGWPQWKTFVMKFSEEMSSISLERSEDLPDDAKIPSLVGARIPLCCPKHVNQRQLEHGFTPIVRGCKRLCLQPFLCQQEGHICVAPCHPRVSHANCPYACQTFMPCGHRCLQSCADRCNCFEITERPLSCSHMTVIGIDHVTMQPIYAKVRHVFKGYCADFNLPCLAEFLTECARCLGPLKTTCLKATQSNHTLEQKTMLCSSCVSFEREVRAKILGEILIQTEEAKRRMKMEMERSLHRQQKASLQGLFQEGSLVTICDVSKILKPLCAETDFPGLRFVDYDAPEFYPSMVNAYGTFVSRHVDVDDLSEVRNLIRLRDGQYVLVADGGVRLIRTISCGVAQQLPLLLQGYKSDTNSSLVDREAEDLTNNEAFEKVSKMVGRSYYLAQPLTCGDRTIFDKVVYAKELDPLSSENVVVECQLMSVTQNTEKGCGDDDGSAPAKKRRLERKCAHHEKLRAIVETLTFTAPIAFLESMDGYVQGGEVLVLDTTRQVTDPHDVEAFEAVLAQKPEIDLKNSVVSTASIEKDTPFTLLGIVNPPLHLEKQYGPCAVLQKHVRLITVRSASRGRDVKRRFSSVRYVSNSCNSDGNGVVVLVPFVFTAADELLEAENSLDAAGLEKFERRVRDIIAEKSEELALRNDEEAFNQQQLMPEVTDEVLSQDRFVFSSPIPLPTAGYLAEVRTRHARLLCASSTSVRLSKQKDALALKQEQLGRAKWVESMRTLYAQDNEADVAYCRGLQLKAALEK